jgi:putative transposase
MDADQSLSHTKWNCKYHVVFIPECRRKTLYVELRRHPGEVFRSLAAQREIGHVGSFVRRRRCG